MYPSVEVAIEAEILRLRAVADAEWRARRLASLRALRDSGFRLNDAEGPRAEEIMRLWDELEGTGCHDQR